MTVRHHLSGIGRRWISFALGERTAWIVAIVPLVLGIAFIGAVGGGERDRLATDQLPAGFDSTLAVELAAQLPEAEGSVAVIVFSAGQEAVLSGPELGQLGAVLAELSPGGPVLIPSEDGSAALGIVTIEATSATQVGDAVGTLRADLAEMVPPGLTAQVTGPAGIEADLAAVFDGANVRLLGATALVVAILLILTYRSPVLWFIPLTVVGVADQVAAGLATRVLARADIAWNESTVGILSVLVFGAGTNYALLLISRYRDELRRVEDRRGAMSVALVRTAEPVLTSAGTVVAGVLTLLLSLVPTTRGLGLACAVGIVVAATFVLGVLPSAMVMFPRGVFWPKVPAVGEATLDERRSPWRRAGEAVARRPALVAALVVGCLAIAAAAGTGIRLGLDSSEQFLRTPESIVAAERIGQSFPAGTANPTQVVTRADPEQVTSAVAAVPGVASAMEAVAADGVARIDVVLEAAEGSAESQDAVLAIRAAVTEYPDTHVGGPEAQTIDARDAASRDRLLIIPSILVLVLISLAALLMSVVAPILLVATVAGTYFASIGIGWLIFSGPLGFSALDEQVPLLAFLFLVALGVDYNIFLVTRARQESRTHGSDEGMLRALGATGGVITSAGILLAAVFAVLGVLPLVVLAQLGVVVGIGVLLDTLVVRTLLVPALALLLGERFWWPRAVTRA